MSLNKSRKRLIKKYYKMFNSHPIGLKISTDGGKTFFLWGIYQALVLFILGILVQEKFQLANLVLEILK